MNAINDNNDDKYKILQEEDYNITITDQGSTLFGGIHEICYLENFEIKNPEAYLSDEAPIYISSTATVSNKIYYNDKVNNDDTLLIIGDSYFDMFLYDDFAESFHKVLLIWGFFVPNLVEIIDYYQPSIVIMENAERCDRTDEIIIAANNLQLQ